MSFPLNWFFYLTTEAGELSFNQLCSYGTRTRDKKIDGEQ